MATLVGDLGDNTIIGGLEADFIEGKEGNDWLDGKGAGDVYKYNLGDGYDVIANADAHDKLLFGEGISRKNLLFIKDGSDLVIKINHCKGKVTVKDAFLFDFDYQGYIMFDDGSKLTASEITQSICAARLIYGSDDPETIYGTNENDYIDSLAGKDKVYGMGGNDIIHSCKDDDYLDGGPGKDFLQGCGGNDTYIVDNSGDIVDEKFDSGDDTVHAYANYTLAANIESLYLRGNAYEGMGNAQDNTILGNKHDNFLHGAEGDDIIYAKAGNDTIIGCYGNDKIYGGDGADKMIGYDGDDRYTVDNTGDKVVEQSDHGYDSVYSSVSYTLTDNVEKLTLTENALNAFGNDEDNLIYGNKEDNKINAGAGNDVIYDYSGSDVYEFFNYSGCDTIYNKNKSTDDFDTIRFGYDISKEEIAFFEKGSDLVIRYNTGHEVRIKNYDSASSANARIEAVQDGSYLTDDDVGSIVANLAAYQADNGIEFNNAEEVAQDPGAMNLIAGYWN